MSSLLSGLPGTTELRAIARRVDTARHRGVPDGCLLELDLQTVPPESSNFDPIAFVTGGGRPMLLREAVAAIHRAAADDRVAGLIARVQLPSVSAGPVQELRAAVAEFSAVKPSVAWAETYPDTLSYYLATAFGEIWMQPSGTVGLVGFATNALFLRQALDKLGVQPQFVACGEYKSAVNLFTEDGYTDAHREADGRLIESLHGQVLAAVAEARRLDPAALDVLLDRAPLLRDDAVRHGLLDRIGFRDEAYGRIAELVGNVPAAPGDDVPAAPGDDVPAAPADDVTAAPDGPEAPPRLYLSRYAKAGAARPTPTIPGRKPRPGVAVVSLSGPIVSGRGGRQLSPLGTASAGGDTIAAALREAGAADDVAAVVLRVDSPGGSITGSETIWREVVRLREAGKPIVASMGAVAASGGYYVSMAADVIVANPGTITGSIGVITGKFVARDLKERLGVGSDSVRTNANADAWSPNRPFTDEQRARVEAEADLFYDDFVGRVAEGRGLSADAVETVARGRVWTGADAAERGLVDELGGLRTAIQRAKVLAGFGAEDDVRLVTLPGSGLLDVLRPKPSSHPAAASLPDVVTSLIGRSVAGAMEHADRSMTGAHALWLGHHRF